MPLSTIFQLYHGDLTVLLVEETEKTIYLPQVIDKLQIIKLSLIEIGTLLTCATNRSP
jgi:hypothetical protein